MFRPVAGLRNRSLKAQLITLLFVLTAGALVVISFLGMRALLEFGDRTRGVASDAMKKRAEQLMVRATDATADKTSLLFKAVQTESNNAVLFTKSILDNPGSYSGSGWKFDVKAVHEPTGQYGNAASEAGSVMLQPFVKATAAIKAEFEHTSYLDDLFPHVLANEPNAVAIYFIGKSGDVRYYPNIELWKVTPPDYDPTTDVFFTAGDPAHDPGKTMKWTKVYDDPAGNGLLMTATNPIYTATGAFAGVIGMDVTLKNIAKNIEDYSPIESSYAFLIDQDGRAIALPRQGYQDLLERTPKDGEFGSDLSKVNGDFGAVLTSMRAGKTGFEPVSSGKTGLYVAYQAIEGTSFSLGIVSRQSAMLKVVTDLESQVSTSANNALYYQFIPAGIVILMIVWLIGFMYIRDMTRPIKELTLMTTEVANGNFDVATASAAGNDEIGQLTRSFYSMVGDLQSSRQKIDEQNQELLHSEQTRLKASINALHIGFIMTDSENNVIVLNDAAKQILSDDPKKFWSTAEIDERLGSAVDFKHSLDESLQTAETLDKREVVFGNMVLRIFIAPIIEEAQVGAPQKLGTVVLIEDITEAKQLEHSKDEFFSIASHELRTPLTAIRGNSAMIERMYTDKVHEQDFNEMVGDIHDASVRLIDIVNDFLDAARLEQGKIAFENQSFNIHEVLAAVRYEMTTVAREKGITLKIDEKLNDPHVFADKNRVKQVVYNLVGNAMKFTEKGSVTISTQPVGTRLKVMVSDTGPGISVSEQRLLFRKFRQASNNFTTRDARGTGLGLYISKLLCEQMGGRIKLERSELGVGTTFSFSLPVATKTQQRNEGKAKA